MASTVQDMRKIRMSKFRNLCIVTLPFAAYVFYALSGLYTLEIDISRLKEQLLWWIFSENIRFKHDSSTLRNNNTFVVGANHIIGLSHLTFRKRKAA